MAIRVRCRGKTPLIHFLFITCASQQVHTSHLHTRTCSPICCKTWWTTFILHYSQLATEVKVFILTWRTLSFFSYISPVAAMEKNFASSCSTCVAIWSRQTANVPTYSWVVKTNKKSRQYNAKSNMSKRWTSIFLICSLPFIRWLRHVGANQWEDWDLRQTENSTI